MNWISYKDIFRLLLCASDKNLEASRGGSDEVD